MTNPLIIQLFCEENLCKVKENNGKLFAQCPFCGKEYKHFNIDLKTGLYFCYHCSAKGNFYQLVKHITGSFPNMDTMEEQYTSELSLQELQNIFSSVQETSNNQKYQTDWKIDTCEIDTIGRIPNKARNYLLSRGVSTEMAKKLKFRVAVSGRYNGRIIMPITENDVVQNFVARLIGKEGKRYTGPHKNEGYTNKGELLWNLDKLQYNTEIVLVEGIFDGIAIMNKFPIVALLGKSLSNIQAEKILEKAKSVIILLDAEFVESAKKIAEKLLGFIPIKIGIMKKGDPSDSPEMARQAIKNAVDYYSI